MNEETNTSTSQVFERAKILLSARRQTVRQTWQTAEPLAPPGMTKAFKAGSWESVSSMACSNRWMSFSDRRLSTRKETLVWSVAK